MMDFVHVRSYDNQAQPTIERMVYPNVRVFELGIKRRHREVNSHDFQRQPKHCHS